MSKKVVYAGDFARQLDLPEEIADGNGAMRPTVRFKDGSLHLAPGRVHVLTNDEYTLALGYKDLKRHLRVIGDAPEPEPVVAKAKPVREIGGRRGEASSQLAQPEAQTPLAPETPRPGPGRPKKSLGGSSDGGAA